jgi:hypothetical protein
VEDIGEVVVVIWLVVVLVIIQHLVESYELNITYQKSLLMTVVFLGVVDLVGYVKKH